MNILSRVRGNATQRERGHAAHAAGAHSHTAHAGSLHAWFRGSPRRRRGPHLGNMRHMPRCRPGRGGLARARDVELSRSSLCSSDRTPPSSRTRVPCLDALSRLATSPAGSPLPARPAGSAQAAAPDRALLVCLLCRRVPHLHPPRPASKSHRPLWSWSRPPPTPLTSPAACPRLHPAHQLRPTRQSISVGPSAGSALELLAPARPPPSPVPACGAHRQATSTDAACVPVPAHAPGPFPRPHA